SDHRNASGLDAQNASATTEVSRSRGSRTEGGWAGRLHIAVLVGDPARVKIQGALARHFLAAAEERAGRPGSKDFTASGCPAPSSARHSLFAPPPDWRS